MAEIDAIKYILKQHSRIQREHQLLEEYIDHLKKIGQKDSPHCAHLFALKKIKESGEALYLGFKEREIVLLLEGTLPELYD